MLWIGMYDLCTVSVHVIKAAQCFSLGLKEQADQLYHIFHKKYERKFAVISSKCIISKGTKQIEEQIIVNMLLTCIPGV